MHYLHYFQFNTWLSGKAGIQNIPRGNLKKTSLTPD